MTVRRVVIGCAALAVVTAAAGCSASSPATVAVSSSTSTASVPSSAPQTSSAAEVAAEKNLEAAIGSVRDRAFLGILRIAAFQYGPLTFADDQTLIVTAKKVCEQLTSGRAPAVVISDVSTNYGGDDQRGRYFTEEAVSSFCPDRSQLIPR